MTTTYFEDIIRYKVKEFILDTNLLNSMVFLRMQQISSKKRVFKRVFRGVGNLFLFPP